MFRTRLKTIPQEHFHKAVEVAVDGNAQWCAPDIPVFILRRFARLEPCLSLEQSALPAKATEFQCRVITWLFALLHIRQENNAMKPTPDKQLLVALQHTVTTALKQWLDGNKGEVLGAMRETVLESEAAQNEQRQSQRKRSEFMTAAELAQRWQLHPESVRKMIRQRRVPRVIVGRHNRIALSTIEGLEKSGAVPSQQQR